MTTLIARSLATRRTLDANDVVTSYRTGQIDAATARAQLVHNCRLAEAAADFHIRTNRAAHEAAIETMKNARAL